MSKFITTLPEDRSIYLSENVVADVITPDSLIKEFKLDSWEARKAPNHDLQRNPIRNSHYVYRHNLDGTVPRDRNILNTHVKDSYNIIQFKEGIRWFDYFVREGLLVIESALIYEDLHLGVTCDLGFEGTVQGEDRVERYFILGLSHAPGFPRILGFTDIRPVCSNTLYAASAKALGKANAAFNLEADPAKAMAEAKACINFQERRFNDVELPAYRELTKITTTDAERDLLYRKLVGMPLEGWDVPERLMTRYEMLSNAYESSPGMEMFGAKEHTGWRVLQAVTYAAGQSDNGFERFKSKYGSPMTKNTYKWLEDRLPVSAIKVGSKYSLV
jgi:hypothetical protein